MNNQVKFLNVERNDRGIPIVPVEYVDSWAINDPATRAEVTQEIENILIPAINEHIANRGSSYKRGEENHVTSKFYAQSEVIRKWKSTMPTAEALYPLQKPEHKKLADGTPFDEAASRYFPHSLDGEGLRSRAAIMSEIMFDKFRDAPNDHELHWASLACGAAIPVFEAASRLTELGKSVNIYLADIDSRALNFAKRMAEDEYNLHDSISIERRNILRLNKLINHLGENRFNAIDILGFFEYLPADDWSYRKYKVKMTMPGAIKFLRAAYTLLSPGGMLVLGNMRDTHSQLPFATQVVQWPYIRPRSIDRVTDIIGAAGIDTKHLVYYQAGDGVYSVAAITK